MAVAFMMLTILTVAAASKVSIRGHVVDASTYKALDYADALVLDMNDKVVASATVSDGNMLVSSVAPGEVMLVVKLLGYETYLSEKFVLRESRDVDVGVIKLKPLSRGLQEVTVVGEKKQIVYKLDRQTLSSNASAASGGGTAIDILSTSPSVQVDSNGDLTLRGSGNYLVYIDGKPSSLFGSDALRQIPASTIKDVEIITTPSARYKAEGDVGIIHITTKHNVTEGWSGLVNAAGGLLGTWSLNSMLNYRQGHHDWYIGGTTQNIVGKSDFNQKKTTEVADIRTTSISDGERWRKSYTHIANGGWMYDDGKHHDAVLDLQVGRLNNWRGGDMTYNESRTNLVDQASSNHTFNSHDKYNLCKDMLQGALNYRWRINTTNELLLAARVRYDSHSIEYTESNMFDMNGDRYEGTRGYEEEHHWDCDGSLTYKRRFNQKGNLESGYQYTTYSEIGGYRIKYWNRDAGRFEWQDHLATPFNYRRQVHSIYAMLNDEIGKISYEAGLRTDRVIDGLQIEVAKANRHIKRLHLFPSAHVAYNAEKTGNFLLGYSHRTNRPGIWNLEPYITYEDYYTKKIGNPDIRPEYIHSAELGWNKALSDGGSVAATAYYRHRKDISDWVRRPYEPGVTLDSIVNAGNQNEAGVELNATVKPVKWWNSTLNGSVFHYDFNSKCPVCTDRDGWHCLVNWLNAFTVAHDTKLQFDTHFTGPKILTQGREKAYVYFDLAARRQFAKGKLAVSLVAHDVFHTARYYNTRTSSGLSSITRVRPKYLNLMLSVSYNFNASRHKGQLATESNLFEGKEF